MWRMKIQTIHNRHRLETILFAEQPAVAEFRNFRRATAALNVSQPTLSHPSPDPAIEASVFAEERLIGVVPPGHRFAGNRQDAFNEFTHGSIILLGLGPITRENWRNNSPSSIELARRLRYECFSNESHR
jgi:DNA-binding transcriptional LysR family regulator